MDKLDMILAKLNTLERIESDIKAIKTDNREIHKKIDKLTENQERLEEKQEQTWQAVLEIHKELTENSAKIKVIDNKVKAL